MFSTFKFLTFAAFVSLAIGFAPPPANAVPTITIAPGASPGGYLPLSGFGVAPIAGMGDETLVNFNVPQFSWAGQTWNRIGVDSNGYIVVGGGDPALDNSMLITKTFPTPLDRTTCSRRFGLT